MDLKSGYFETSDGAKLHFLEKGEGSTLVMVPGWSQTAEQFKYQFEGLSDKFRCIAIDMRGHGDSENVEVGYTIQRLATDLYEFISNLDSKELCLMGHSMGCSVIWGLLDKFGDGLINKLIFIDEPPFLMINPEWDIITLQTAGALFTKETLVDTCLKLKGPDSEEFTREMILGMFRKKLSPEEEEWIFKCSLKLPRNHAADLLLNHVQQDWRELFAKISVKTLVIGAEGSQVPWQSQKWIHDQIPDSEFVLFEESERVKHFIFLENPDRFNLEVIKFLS